MRLWGLSKRELQAKLSDWEDVREANNREEVERARLDGFETARKMFIDERKQLLQFASLAALGNAKHPPALLETAIKNFQDQLKEGK